jgi:putative CocE/NonD family hydrolase
MLAMNLMPPTNADSNGRWYKAWLQRLEQGTPFVMPWVEHRTFDEFWSAKAVDPAKIKVPTFIIGGWRDIFPNGMPDVYARLRCVKKLWMGPWMHTMPALSPYEPLDHLHELKRWFDRWLRGEKNGIENEPPVLLNVQRANVWKHEREWPIERASMRTMNLSSTGALTRETQREEQAESYLANQTVGTAAGLWDPMGLGVGAPLDQTADDLQSLSYTSEPLDEDTEISGAPDARIFCELKSGDDVNLVVKLSDVDPSGASSLITTGWLRGTCRNSTARAEPLPHDEAIEFRIPMWATSYSVAKGNRIRVSVSCADFPHLWPTRTNPEIRVHFGGHRASSIAIPIVPAPKQPIEGPPIPRASILPRPASFVPIWKIDRDLVTGQVAVTTGEKNAFPLPQGGLASIDHIAVARVTPSRPEGAIVEGDTTIRVQAPVIGNLEVVTTARVTQDAISLGGRISIDGRIIFEKRWQK